MSEMQTGLPKELVDFAFKRWQMRGEHAAELATASRRAMLKSYRLALAARAEYDALIVEIRDSVNGGAGRRKEEAAMTQPGACRTEDQ